MNEHAARRQLVRFCHQVYERNLLVAMDGNLSVRLPTGNIVCTRAGCHKGFVTEDDLIVVDAQGNYLRGRGRPTSEMKMHLACYDERPDIEAVIHTHPPNAIAFTLADRSLERLVLPEVVLTIGTVPTVPYATTGTTELADRIRPYVRERDVILMDRHGAVALGTSLLDAFCKLETLEHTARIILAANGLGEVKELPGEEAVHLRSMGLKRYGGPPDSVARADDPLADLPRASFGEAYDPYPSPLSLAPRTQLIRAVEAQPDSVRAMARAIHRETDAVLTKHS